MFSCSTTTMSTMAACRSRLSAIWQQLKLEFVAYFLGASFYWQTLCHGNTHCSTMQDETGRERQSGKREKESERAK